MKYRKILSLAVGLALSSSALAAPTGAYVMVGGGGSYLANSSLKSTSITSTTSGNNINYKLGYTQKGKFNYMGRGEVGYYFNSDPTNVNAFGVEAGYNYFGPIKSSATSHFQVPGLPQSFSVTSSEKTKAWAGDLEAVYEQDLVIPNTSLIFKLGIGYQHMQSTISNPANVSNGTLTIPSPVSASDTIKNNGFGVAGGMGIQYNFTKNIGMRIEFDGMKGEKKVGYADGLAGLVFSF